MTKKQVLRMAAFALLVCMLLAVIMELFEYKNSENQDKRFYSLRAMEEDVVDAVFIGTSGIDPYWIAAKAYEEYGMSTWSLGADDFPVWLYTNMIDEVLIHQNPSLFILDIRGLTQYTWEHAMNYGVRPVLCAMDFFSRNRWEAAIKSSLMMHEIDPSLPKWDLSLFFPFIQYHSLWSAKDFSLNDHWRARPHEYGGFNVNHMATSIAKVQSVLYPEPLMTELHPVTERALYELLDYIKEKDLNVLFLNTPQIRDDAEEGYTNKVYAILEEEGMDYVAYYLPEQEVAPDDHKILIDLELNGDFYNESHINYYGAEKFTVEFAKYLDTHYDLPDRRGDEKVQSTWDGVYAALKQEMDSRVPAEMPAE